MAGEHNGLNGTARHPGQGRVAGCIMSLSRPSCSGPCTQMYCVQETPVRPPARQFPRLGSRELSIVSRPERLGPSVCEVLLATSTRLHRRATPTISLTHAGGLTAILVFRAVFADGYWESFPRLPAMIFLHICWVRSVARFACPIQKYIMFSGLSHLILCFVSYLSLSTLSRVGVTPS